LPFELDLPSYVALSNQSKSCLIPMENCHPLFHLKQSKRQTRKLWKSPSKGIESHISDTLRARMRQYALECGNATAVQKYSDDFDAVLNESTV